MQTALLAAAVTIALAACLQAGAPGVSLADPTIDDPLASAAGRASLVLAGLIAAGGFLYFKTFSPDRDAYPVRGIDVSHHQGEIDWQRVDDLPSPSGCHREPQ